MKIIPPDTGTRGKPKRELADEYENVTVSLSPQAIALVDQLLATGLFGLSRSEVVERLFLDRLRSYMGRDGNDFLLALGTGVGK